MENLLTFVNAAATLRSAIYDYSTSSLPPFYLRYRTGTCHCSAVGQKHVDALKKVASFTLPAFYLLVVISTVVVMMECGHR